jgi:hypothetical protein
LQNEFRIGGNFTLPWRIAPWSIEHKRRDRLASIMESDRPSTSRQTARILRFRRGGKGHVLPPSGPVQDLARFGRGPIRRDRDPGEYRHRMIVNAAAFLFVMALIAAGVWIADTMAEMRKNQDCVLSGRRGCSPVEVIPKGRW